MSQSIILDGLNFARHCFSLPGLWASALFRMGSGATSDFVTASDFSHERSLKLMVESILRFRTRSRVYVFDLGIKSEHVLNWLKSQPRVELIDFPFSNHPWWYALDKNAGAYAWKSACVKSAAERFLGCEVGGVLTWIDAGCLLSSRLPIVETLATKHWVFTNSSSGSNRDWIHPASNTALQNKFDHLSSQAFMSMKQPSAALISFSMSNPVATKVIDLWETACSIETISSPNGASKTNHRFDQAVLSFVLQVVGGTRGRMQPAKWPQAMLGFKIHQDVDMP